MNKSAELYDMEGFKFKDSDLVSSWIGSLLDETQNQQSSKNSDYLKEPAQIIAYPVERILTPRNEAAVVLNPGDFYLEEVKKPEISPEVKIDPEKELPYFTFTSGNSLYGIPVLHINEIIKYKEPVNIPSKKIGLLGLIPYRAKIIPIYNFSSLAGASLDVKTIFKYIVICVYESKLFGLCVDDIKNIIKVKNKNLISSATFKFWSSNKISTDVFEGENGKFYSLVDIKSIYNYLKS
ncbi:MAG: chemotaxis protein CheW [Deltaproteobacteria bacterium]|jgi:chemotaxis signal transduction protein|nr:chemotaxis protein CheW [Deltaproteobacteria bacterium]MCL5879685.1 chemotaxis protein CheW [Deltaproteobacteria bacterium]MDA8304056.1 chemotaxis protein CheW [Deltaproteobacteria bacterium]